MSILLWFVTRESDFCDCTTSRHATCFFAPFVLFPLLKFALMEASAATPIHVLPVMLVYRSGGACLRHAGASCLLDFATALEFNYIKYLQTIDLLIYYR